MRVHICAVGRLRVGPERVLLDDYLARFDRGGRSIGLGPATLHEVEDKTGSGPDAEAALLARVVPKNAVICILDERGKTLSSPDFAASLARWRDDGWRDLAFVIGGADGIAKAMRQTADFTLSFGAMVWPHRLVRVMLSEQLYRAVSILAGAPYHRA
ncbi:MAG: 23S rRNA (pseudouridine(1915)-N(3))-methyltransferase RlmH [Halocynthiibacter sp.]